MKKGITLIELMLVVSIVSFISISTITGFSISSERLKFQNQLTNLESFLSSHRATSFNDTTNNNNYSIFINQNQAEANIQDSITNIHVSNSPLLFVIPNQELVLETFNGRTANSNWIPLPANQTIQIQIDPEQRVCEISYGNNDLLSLHIPIRKPDEISPSKHLYIQRTNCLIESLNDQIQN